MDRTGDTRAQFRCDEPGSSLESRAALQEVDRRGLYRGGPYRVRRGGREAHLRRVGLCFVPQRSLVSGDVMLAQKIALETDEGDALTVANKFLLSR